MLRELTARGIRDKRVLTAMERIPRHDFVRETLEAQAYGEHALPIGSDQTISQPYIVARTTELLQVGKGHSVLEIGTGSGYHTAVLALLAARVYSLERVPELAQGALKRIRELGFDNVKIQIFDGTVGWSDVGPFDRILVLAAAPKAPPPLLDQLKLGGRMVIPEGSRERQQLVVYTRTERSFQRQEVEPATFVPLIGRHGWEGSR
jgi:protein-L-isoaspartate(D-aspartate) O-methyltransferase